MKVQDENAAYDEINGHADVGFGLCITDRIHFDDDSGGTGHNGQFTERLATRPALAKPQTKAITITADGTIFLDTVPVSMELLESTLQQYKAVNPALPVVIKGDAAVQYEKVVGVLALVG